MSEQLEGFTEAAPETAIAPAQRQPGDGLPGPFAVGRYAGELRGHMRGIARVRIIGEVTGLRVTAKSVYFELRDGEGAVPCSMWRDV